MGVMPMTRDEAIHKVVQLAFEQVGYKEGVNNWNIYAADTSMQGVYGWNVQNQPWCEIFVEWLFVHLFGGLKAKKMTYGASASCAAHAQLYKDDNAWSMNPRKGDQIYFNINGGINHTGIVADVTGQTVTTIEGNSSDGVAKRTYYAGDSSIAGYGVPDWAAAADVPEPADNTLTVDGECGQETWAAIAKKMPLVKKGSKGWAVVALQAALNFLGADLDADGDCGRLTEAEIKEFQGGKL